MIGNRGPQKDFMQYLHNIARGGLSYSNWTTKRRTMRNVLGVGNRRQGLWHQKQEARLCLYFKLDACLTNCNIPSTDVVLITCIDQIQLNSCSINNSNLVVREGQGGVYLLGSSKTFLRIPTGLEKLTCIQRFQSRASYYLR